MALSLQANKLGLYTHAMGGFEPDKAFDVTGMDHEKYDVICAVAIGKIGDVNSLPEEIREREAPSTRNSIEDIVFEVVSK